MDASQHQQPPSRFAIVFVAWGAKAFAEIGRFLENSAAIEGYDLILITETGASCESIEGRIKLIVRTDFEADGLQRKCGMLELLPTGYDAFCFLDTDAIVIGDISYGFEKALLHGIAASPAPHYSLDHFWGFHAVMAAESLPCHGQLQYNTGVIFFSLSHPATRNVFKRWKHLARKHRHLCINDQPFFTLAMEQEHFCAFTLSIGYNYRGFGDPISGDIRIWHSHENPPEGLNQFEAAWPRRRAWPQKIEQEA